MNYLPAEQSGSNDGPAWFAIGVGLVFAAYGNKVGQQVGIALIGVGATKLVNDRWNR
jgi:hypothetical protein